MHKYIDECTPEFLLENSQRCRRTIRTKRPITVPYPPAAVHGDAFHIHLTILNRLPNEDAIRISFSVVPLQMARYNHRAKRWSPPHSIPTTNSWCTMSRAFMIPDGDSRIGRVHTANRRRWIQITVHDVGVGFNERITPPHLLFSYTYR